MNVLLIEMIPRRGSFTFPTVSNLAPIKSLITSGDKMKNPIIKKKGHPFRVGKTLARLRCFNL